MFYQLITNRFICSALLLVQRRCDQAVDEESWTSRSKSKSWSSGAELKSRGRVDWGKFCKQFPFSDILFHVQYRQYRWHRETVKSLMGKISRRCVWQIHFLMVSRSWALLSSVFLPINTLRFVVLVFCNGQSFATVRFLRNCFPIIFCGGILLVAGHNNHEWNYPSHALILSCKFTFQFRICDIYQQLFGCKLIVNVSVIFWKGAYCLNQL